MEIVFVVNPYVVVDFQRLIILLVGLTLTQLQLETRCSGPSRQDNKVLTAYSDSD